METLNMLPGLKPVKGLRLPMNLLRQVMSSVLSYKYEHIHPVTKPKELARILSLSTGKGELTNRGRKGERHLHVLGCWNAEQGVYLRPKHGLASRFAGVAGVPVEDTIDQCFEAMTNCSTAQVRRTWVLVSWHERVGAGQWERALYLLSGEQLLIIDNAPLPC